MTRNWKRHELQPATPKKGAIALDPKPQESADKRGKLIGKSSTYIPGRKQ